jgi:hypothetical protein
MSKMYLRLGLAVLIALNFAPVAVEGAVAAEHHNAPAITLEGEVTVVHIDYFEQGQSKVAYYLRDLASQEVFELEFERKPPKSLKTGTKITVKGRAVGRKLWVGEIAAGVESDGGAGTPTAETTVAEAANQRRTVLMVLNMSTSPGYYTEATADTGAGALFTASDSVNKVYQEASFGQLGFPGDRATDVVILEIPYVAGCPFYTIAADADAAATNAGVDLAPYQHKVYLVPPSSISDCAWLALGELGTYGTSAVRRSWSTRNGPVAYAHEIGHNLGWHHAATDTDVNGQADSEYGDISDVMGYCCYRRKFNSVHVDQIGWLDNLNGIRTDVFSSGIYDIAPLGGDRALNTAPQVLRIDWPGSDEDYYLSYRQPTGLDATIHPLFITGVNIHHASPQGNWSYFIDSLTDGESYTDAERGISITQTASGPDFVTVNVSFSGCAVAPALVALGPSSVLISDNGPASVSFEVSVTNNDAAGCDATTYDLAQDLGLLGGAVTPASLPLAAGETGTATLTVDVDGQSDGIYTLWVDASDTSGRHAAAGGSATLQIDTTQPLAPGNVVASKSKVKGSSSVKVTWQAGDDVSPGSGINGYRVYRDGAWVGNATASGYVDSGAAVDGSYIYTVTANDHAGHESLASADAPYTGASKGNKGSGGNKGRGPNK